MSGTDSVVRPILVVDDEENVLSGYEVLLRMEGFEDIICCKNGPDALKEVRAREPGVVILDLLLPGMPGETVLERLRNEHPAVPVIVATGVDDIALAVGCIKAGAFDYIVKPIGKERLGTTVRHALTMRALRDENEALKSTLLDTRLRHPEAFAQILTADPNMIAAMRYIEAIARTDAPVLITGETGTGKELFARSLHALSGRGGQFVCVNVAGLDDQLFSDSLFGHRKGAFTGAVEDRIGLVRKAQGGSLFLDEIGDLSSISQVKLLRLVEAREYSALGSDDTLSTDARVIVATHQNLDAMRESGRFRQDLFFRLRQHHVQIPPLRDRIKSDLPMLVDHFISKAAARLGKARPSVPPELCPLLATYLFPGNVRELEALIFDAVSRHQSGSLSMALFRNYVGQKLAHFRPLPEPDAQIVFPRQLPTFKQMQQDLIAEAMRRANGNQRIAAQMLGVSQQAISYRLRGKASQPQRKRRA